MCLHDHPASHTGSGPEVTTILIRASLSEPDIDEKYMRKSYIYSTSVTRAPPYTKPIGRMKYLAMISPRQEKSIADHVDVCDQASATEQTVVVMLSREQTVIFE